MDDKDVFLRGKYINLRKPDIQRDVINGHWHSWFSDQSITKYLVHGVFPVSREEQAAIVKDNLSNPKTFLLCIFDADTDEHIGIISLGSIDWRNRNAEIAIVMGETKKGAAALEAMALMSKHAFDRLNLLKLWSGQHEGLWKWVNTLSLIGYRLEGYREAMFIRDGQSWGIVFTGVTAKDFYALQSARGGTILTNDPMALVKKRSKENNVQKVRELTMGMSQKMLYGGTEGAGVVSETRSR